MDSPKVPLVVPSIFNFPAALLLPIWGLAVRKPWKDGFRDVERKREGPHWAPGRRHMRSW
ncbi:uncharacterized protein BJX67DRAFT_281561 [Aspergillus lucknowensis]|uniref:Uncharacterized protein n=1 Tax=Aspergillus lucknowensis TaxID=176173 RepID=A0ABR4M0N8_9EURO